MVDSVQQPLPSSQAIMRYLNILEDIAVDKHVKNVIVHIKTNSECVSASHEIRF